MGAKRSFDQSYVRRRKKEYLSLIIVKFLKAYDAFNDIYCDFYKFVDSGKNLKEMRLSDRMYTLCEKFFIDLKEKSDFLYRSTIDENYSYSDILEKYNALERIHTLADDDYIKNNKTKDFFSELNRVLINQSIDSNINRLFHKLIVIKENLYELEFYKNQYFQEHLFIDKTVALFKAIGYELKENERDSLNHIKKVDKLNKKILSDTKNHTKMLLDICNTLFKDTSLALLDIILDSWKNEVLVLNLLRENDLFEKIYGNGALEDIFTRMYKRLNNIGNSGLEKAVKYLKNNCDNLSGLPLKYIQ